MLAGYCHVESEVSWIVSQSLYTHDIEMDCKWYVAVPICSPELSKTGMFGIASAKAVCGLSVPVQSPAEMPWLP